MNLSPPLVVQKMSFLCGLMAQKLLRFVFLVINRRTLQMSLNSVLRLCRNPCYHPSPSAVFPVFPAITLLPVFPVFLEFLEFPAITLSLCVPVVPVVPVFLEFPEFPAITFPFVSQWFQWFLLSLPVFHCMQLLMSLMFQDLSFTKYLFWDYPWYPLVPCMNESGWQHPRAKCISDAVFEHF